MKEYAGLDVSLKAVSICVSDETGHVLWRGEVVNESDIVIAALSRHAPNLVRAVLETGSCGVPLYRGLEAAAVPIICICARHAKGVLKCKVNKSDANDAEGLAQLARTGWYREVYVKSAEAHVIRAHLLARKQLVKARRDFENQIRALLRVSGFKVGMVAKGRFEARVRRLLEQIPALHLPVDQLLTARRSLLASQDALEVEAKRLAKDDHRLPDLANHARRRAADGAGVGQHHGRPDPVRQVVVGGRLSRSDAPGLPIGRGRLDGAHLQNRRRCRPRPALRSGQQFDGPGQSRLSRQNMAAAESVGR